MKRIVLFWIPLLLLLLVNCTTESFDFGDQEGILVEGSGGGGSSQPNPTIPEGSEDLLGFTNCLRIFDLVKIECHLRLSRWVNGTLIRIYKILSS